MAGRAVQKPRSVPLVSAPNVEDQDTQRALDSITSSVSRLQSDRLRQVVTSDLAIGTNKVQHGLGRRAAGYTLVATVADAAFAHAVDDANPHPEREVWIVVIGAAQPGARLEIW